LWGFNGHAHTNPSLKRLLLLI